jgi:hypothetical protein
MLILFRINIEWSKESGRFDENKNKEGRVKYEDLKKDK